MSVLNEEDRTELLRLSSLSTNPSVQRFLEVSASAIPITKTPSVVAPPLLSTASTPAKVKWIEPRHCWEQDNENITVLVLDLPPFSTPDSKKQVSCLFKEDSLDLIIPPNRRLRLFPLEKSINVSKCTYKVKKTQIEITMKKSEQWQHWGALLAKRSSTEKKAAGDPQNALMDMMKQMYEDGDDTMKKTIAEAMSKSREGADKDPLGSSGGRFGGGRVGGGFGGGGDFEEDEFAI